MSVNTPPALRLHMIWVVFTYALTEVTRRSQLGWGPTTRLLILVWVGLCVKLYWVSSSQLVLVSLRDTRKSSSDTSYPRLVCGPFGSYKRRAKALMIDVNISTIVEIFRSLFSCLSSRSERVLTTCEDYEVVRTLNIKDRTKEAPKGPTEFYRASEGSED